MVNSDTTSQKENSDRADERPDKSFSTIACRMFCIRRLLRFIHADEQQRLIEDISKRVYGFSKHGA